LKIIGQGSVANDVTAGTESYEVGMEASDSILKKMYEKSKEYMKKAWEIIRNLIIKVVKFAKGLIGKGDDTATQLKELLKKAKEDKRTNLKADKFDDATAKRLIGEVKVLALLKGDKGIDDSALKEQVDSLAGIMANVKDGEKTVATIAGLKAKIEKFIKEAGEETTVKDIFDILKTDEGELGNQKGIEFVGNVSSEIQNLIKEAIDSDIENGMVEVISNDGDVVKALVVYSNNEDVLEEAKKSDKKGKEALELAKKIVNSLRVKVVKVAPELKDVEGYAEKLSPIPFNSAEVIVKQLEKATKKAEKVAGSAEKNVEKAIKDLNSLLDEIEKSSEVKEGTPGIKGLAAEVSRAFINFVSNAAREETKAVAEFIKNAVRPKWGDIIKESVRLYEK